MRIAVLLFLVSVAVSVYTVAGYPILLSLLARRHRRPVRKHFVPRTVSVILPVRNASEWIGPKLDCLLALDYPRHLLDIIVVSDESTDGTDDIVRSYTGRHPVQLIRIQQGGKTAGLNAGLQAAHGEILFLTDVRQQIEPQSLTELVSCFADPSVGVVSGELIILDGETQEARDVGLYWRYEKWIRKQLCAIDSFHGATGCIYAMRRELAKPLPAYTLNDDMYLPLIAFLAGYRVVFEENARAYDVATDLKTEFPRKVRTLAGVWQIVGLLPALIGPANRMWIHFLSHKVARLLLPYALMVSFVSSFFLPGPWSRIAAGAHMSLLTLSVLDPLIRRGNALKKISSPARTFLVMMLASLFAGRIFFVPAKTLWIPTQIGPAAGYPGQEAGYSR